MLRVVVLALLVCGCTIVSEEAVEKGPPGSVYSETPAARPWDWRDWLNQEIHDWLAVYRADNGKLLGYLGVFTRNYHKQDRRYSWYVVFDADWRVIGAVTDKGVTVRYHYSETEWKEEYVGTYRVEEAISHLFRVEKRTDAGKWFVHAAAPSKPLSLRFNVRFLPITAAEARARRRARLSVRRRAK